jgi:ParB family chromosome partitioning protein
MNIPEHRTSRPEPTTIEAIDPELIDCSGAWILWPQEPDRAFIRSMQAVGQLEPILVCPGHERWQLVSGYTRVQACRTLQVPVVALHSRFEDVLTRGVAYIQLNRTRQVDHGGLVKGMRFFQEHVPGKGFRSTVETELGFLASPRELQALVAWSELETSWDRHLDLGRCPLELSLLLGPMEPGDRAALEPLFEPLAWSRNKARNLVTWLREAAVMHGATVVELIDKTGLLSRAASEASPRDRQEAIMARVRTLRYPVLTKLEREFDVLAKGIRRRSAWKIKPEQHFEANGFILEAKAKRREDLCKLVAELQALVEEDAFRPVFDWQEAALD